MTRRSPAWLLAPLALVAVAAALFVIVSNGSGGSGDDSAGPASSSAPASGRTTATPASRSTRTRRRSTYTVRAGDTPSGIAERTGISVARLLELNPDLDAQALTVGQRLKLR
jgi:LysM repeat protein